MERCEELLIHRTPSGSPQPLSANMVDGTRETLKRIEDLAVDAHYTPEKLLPRSCHQRTESNDDSIRAEFLGSLYAALLVPFLVIAFAAWGWA